jgi:hypothetical protein
MRCLSDGSGCVVGNPEIIGFWSSVRFAGAPRVTLSAPSHNHASAGSKAEVLVTEMTLMSSSWPKA